MNATDVVGYAYCADTYHAWCVVEELATRYDLPDDVRKVVAEESNEVALDTIAAFLKVNRDDERSFDSGEFPKVIFCDQIRWEADEDDCGPDACGRCGEPFGS